jgi:hypothetical protein
MQAGQLIYDILVQAPFVAILIIIIVVQRRDFDRAMAELTAEYKKLEDALIRYIDRGGSNGPRTPPKPEN